MRLFHFSDQPGIERFVPRVPSHRPEVDPMVWAVDERHQGAYLFPRECPRILLWPTRSTSDEDLQRWWGDREGTAMLAHVEWDWYERLRTATLYRYELPSDGFEPVETDSWMCVSRGPVTPLRVETIPNIVAALMEAGIELCLMPSLAPLWKASESTMHFSGIRLRNSRTWPGDES